MRTRFRGTYTRGVVAGIVGATALAFWFLIVQYRPWRWSPSFSSIR